MEKLKLVSVRLEPAIIEKLEQIHKRETYWKKTSIINRLLHQLLFCSDPRTLHKMLSEWYAEEKGYTVRFEIDKTKLVREKEYVPVDRD